MRIDTSLRNTAILLVASIVAFTATEWGEAQDRVSGVRRLPPNVQAMLRISSVDVMKTRMKSSRMGEMMEDPALADIRSQLMGKLGEMAAEMEAEVGLKMEELMEVPSGEVLFAVMPTSSNKLGLLAMMDFGESREVVDTLIEKAIDAAEDDGATISTEAIEGVDVTSVANPDKPDGQSVSYCIHESNLIISSSVGVIEGVLVRWDGDDERTFAGNEVYSYIAERCATSHEEPVLEWFVDPISLMTSAMKSSGQQNLQAQMFLSFLPSLGLNSLRGMGGAVDMATEKYDSVNVAMIYVDQPMSGVMGLMHFPADNLQPPAWVPDTASNFVCMNWDLEMAFNSAERIMDMFQGSGAMSKILDRMAEEPNGPKLHLKDDVIDLMSGRIHVFTDLSDPDDVQSARFCVAFGLKDNGEKMSTVLDRIAQTPGFPGEARQFQGNSLYELTVPGPVGGGLNTMGLASVKGHFFLTSHVELLEQIIRGDRPSLAESEIYKAVTSQTPDNTSIIGFQRTETQIRSMYDLLQNEFSELPPFEALRKYFAPTFSYAIPDERGAILMQFSTKSE